MVPKPTVGSRIRTAGGRRLCRKRGKSQMHVALGRDRSDELQARNLSGCRRSARPRIGHRRGSPEISVCVIRNVIDGLVGNRRRGPARRARRQRQKISLSAHTSRYAPATASARPAAYRCAAYRFSPSPVDRRVPRRRRSGARPKALLPNPLASGFSAICLGHPEASAATRRRLHPPNRMMVRRIQRLATSLREIDEDTVNDQDHLRARDDRGAADRRLCRRRDRVGKSAG